MPRRRWIPLVLCLGFSGTASAQPLDPLGVWSRSDGNARVRITRCGAPSIAVVTTVPVTGVPT